MLVDIAGEAIREDMPLKTCEWTNETVCDADLSHLETVDVKFVGCKFYDVDFTKASFYQTAFIDCVFSACDFRDSYWKECFICDGRGDGANFERASLHAVKIEHAVLRGINLSHALIDECEFVDSNLSDAGMSAVKIRKTKFKEVDFRQADFFKTPLKGVDLSTSAIEGILLSDNGQELRGLKINTEQAVDIAKRFGVVIV